MNKQKMNKQKMVNQEMTLKDKKRSKLQKQKKQNLQKLKRSKVRYGLMKEDSLGDFQIPIVKQDKTFKSITSDYIIDNIEESNIPYYFDIIKESVMKNN